MSNFSSRWEWFASNTPVKIGKVASTSTASANCWMTYNEDTQKLFNDSVAKNKKMVKQLFFNPF